MSDVYALDVRFDEPVTSLARGTDGTFVVGSRRAGVDVTRIARAVIVASGAYDLPNRLAVPGEDLPHVSHFYHGPHAHYRRHVVIVGGKNSAVEAALDLYRNGAASVTLVHRHAALGDSIKYWVKPDIENRIKEGSVGARFEAQIVEIRHGSVEIETRAGRETLAADAVYLLTGYRSDTALLRSVGAAVEEREGAPVLNDATFESTVENLFVIGAAVAGKQSGKIFIENGRFHGGVVVDVLAERLGAAR